MTTSWGFRTSTGLDFTEGEIVDAHHEACRGTFRTLLDEVGIRPGWRVLDAGCGTGAFLPRLAELVGPAGRVTAVDLAAENVALARDRAAGLGTVTVGAGDLLDLPFPAGGLDAVWCANTVQYLDDAELARALAAFRRLVRPGGRVAIKEIDATLITVRPGDPYLFADFFRAAAPVSPYARQLVRSRGLYRELTAAGLAWVRQRTVLIEHFAPLTAAELRFYAPSCARLARQAVQLGVPGDWTPLLLDPSAPDHPLRAPDAYVAQGAVLAVGTVPPGEPEPVSLREGSG
jgi:ubiquinone/menaquinone biosynthesis C-methylase UbiE